MDVSGSTRRGGEILSFPYISTARAGKGPKRRNILGAQGGPIHYGGGQDNHRKEASRDSTIYVSEDDYDDDDYPNAQSTGALVKPVEAALQTRRMFEESGSGRY